MSVLQEEQGETSKRLLLIVQDDESELAFAKRALKKLQNVRIEEARDGETAKRVLEDGLCPNLILLDLGLPRVDGLEVLAWMRQQPSLQRTRVLLSTGSKDPLKLQKAQELGIDGIVSDNYDLGEWAEGLAKQVSHFLDS